MANPTVIKLQDGNVMPQLGLGVWQASNEEVITAIQKALEVGYRSIDTAAAYKNEEGVGKALKNASVNREELFITTKLWNDDHKRPREALLDSLKKLQHPDRILEPISARRERRFRSESHSRSGR